MTLAARADSKSKPFSGLLETEIRQGKGGGAYDLTELWLGLRWADVCMILFPGVGGLGTETAWRRSGEVALEDRRAVIAAERHSG